MPTEVEARFRAHGLAGRDALVSLAKAPNLGRARLGPPRTFWEEDTYLDTADGALSAERWACRLRARADRVTVSLKGPPESAPAGAIHRRPEVEAPATHSHDPAAWPPSAARDLVDRLRAGAGLVERLTLRQRRTERAAILDGAAFGTLSLDEVTVVHADRERGSFAVVELELLSSDGADGREQDLVALVEAMASRPGLAPDAQTKLEHALELLALPNRLP